MASLWVTAALAIALAYIAWWTASEVERRYSVLEARDGLQATPLYTLLTDRQEACDHCGEELDCRRGLDSADDYCVLWAERPSDDTLVRRFFHPECFVAAAGGEPATVGAAESVDVDATDGRRDDTRTHSGAGDDPVTPETPRRSA